MFSHPGLPQSGWAEIEARDLSELQTILDLIEDHSSHFDEDIFYLSEQISMSLIFNWFKKQTKTINFHRNLRLHIRTLG